MLLASLWLFGRALVRHWLALASGAALFTLLGIYERRSGIDVPWNLYASLLLATVVWASFLAWRDEHAKAERGQLPDFAVKIEGVLSHYFKDEHQTLVFLIIRIINKGADSAVLNYSVKYTTPAGDELPTQLIFLADDFVQEDSDGQRHVIVKAADLISHRTNTPISRGAFQAGKLALIIEGRRDEEIVEGKSAVSVTVSDYLERPYVAEFRGSGRAKEISFVSGEPFPVGAKPSVVLIHGKPSSRRKRRPERKRK